MPSLMSATLKLISSPNRLSARRRCVRIIVEVKAVEHLAPVHVDRDFGPFFLKFCTYFPYNAKLCLNGHEYVKRQLTNRGIGYEALDNGILSCADPKRVQTLCNGLSAEKIDGLLRKWFRKLPHPFTTKDRPAGYRYQISILQAEFSLTPRKPGYRSPQPSTVDLRPPGQ